MSTKQFAVLIATMIVCSMILAGVGSAAPPQSGYILSPAPTSISGCTWPPTANVTVSNGGTLCIINTSTGPQAAISVNGGAFVPIPMSSGQSITGTAPIVVTGNAVSCPTCLTSAVTSLNGKTGALNLTASTTVTAQ